MKEATCAGAVVGTLKQIGVKTLFELPGLHTLPIYDALYDEPDIRRIMVKHEDNASVMADVFGRLTGEPGVALVAAGPGALNSIAGVAQAKAASSPVLHISGTVPTDSLPSALHGLEDPDYLRKVFEPVTKWSARVVRAGDASKTVGRGYALAREPRMGPVHIELPMDVLKARTVAGGSANIVAARPETKGPLVRAISMLESASNPVVFAGKGVARDRATDELVEFAERALCPVVTHSYYPDAFPYSHALFSGDANEWGVDPVAEIALSGSDLILAIGVQWGSAETDLLKRFSKRCIHIDLDRGYPSLRHRPTLRVVGNLKAILSEMSRQVSSKGSPRVAGRLVKDVARANSVHAELLKSLVRERRQSRPIYLGALASELAMAADDDAAVALDGSSSSSWLLDIYARAKSGTFLWPGSYGSIGFAFPASIAAKVVYPDRQVICVTGDGGFLMSYMDMPTPLENDLPITVIVVNNRTYGDIWHIQRVNYKARYIGTELPSINYAELARSFGAEGVRVEEPSMLRPAVRDALRSKKFTVLDVVTDARSLFPSEELKARTRRP